MKTENEISVETAIETDAWKLAELLGVSYSGDCSPFPHGGRFYNTHHWKEYGYSDCVEFCDLGDSIQVALGTINRPDDMETALECCGFDDEEITIHHEIEAAFSMHGADSVVDFGGRYAKEFGEDDEESAWGYALPYIKNLKDE